MYDFAHGQSDSIENITHSTVPFEFIPHRELRLVDRKTRRSTRHTSMVRVST